MNMDVPPLGPIGPDIAPARPGRTNGPGGFFVPAAGAIPSTPPPALQREVEAAARRAEWMHEHGVQLHFEPDPREHRIRVEVRDLDGRLIRTVPPAEALAIATGGPLG